MTFAFRAHAPTEVPRHSPWRQSPLPGALTVMALPSRLAARTTARSVTGSGIEVDPDGSLHQANRPLALIERHSAELRRVRSSSLVAGGVPEVRRPQRVVRRGVALTSWLYHLDVFELRMGSLVIVALAGTPPRAGARLRRVSASGARRGAV